MTISKWNKKCILALSSVSLLSGCASMFGDNTRQIRVDSHPQGADIYVDGQRYGSTPSVITISSYIYGGKQLVLKKQDYKDQVIMINAAFQPVGLWNILNFPIGTIIDLATGDILKIDPVNLSVTGDLSAVSVQK